MDTTPAKRVQLTHPCRPQPRGKRLSLSVRPIVDRAIPKGASLLPEPPAEAPLETLVARAQAGNRDALAEVATRCRPLVYRWALVSIGDADDADDVAQTVLARLAARLGQFRRGARFTTWLYGITRNAITDVARKRTRRRRLLELHVDAAGAEVPPTAPDSLDTTALAALVRRAFDVLPARQREVLNLVDLEGYSAADAARMLGIETPTARVHLLRARHTIREHILATHPALVEDRQ